MARISKSTSTKARSHKSRDLSDHIVAEAKVKEEGAIDAPVKNIDWDVKQGEVHSDVDFRNDMGYGDARVLRSFDFRANPEAFAKRTPSKQELFNAHSQQIELFLMKDGLKVVPELSPQLKLSKNRQGYRIVVVAEPMKGFRLDQRPDTLMNILNERKTG